MKSHRLKRSLRPGRWVGVLPSVPAIPPAVQSRVESTQVPLLYGLRAYEAGSLFLAQYLHACRTATVADAVLAGFIHGYGTGWRQRLRLAVGPVVGERMKRQPKPFAPTPGPVGPQAQQYADYILSSADLALPGYLGQRDFQRALAAVERMVRGAYVEGYGRGRESVRRVGKGD